MKNNRQRQIDRNYKHHEELMLKTRGVIGSRYKTIAKPKRKKSKKIKPIKIKHWASYKDYCKSKEFSNLKKKVFKKYGNHCIVCTKKASTIHHLIYRIWGTEKVSDCRPVCNVHHLEVFHYDIMLSQLFDKINGDRFEGL